MKLRRSLMGGLLILGLGVQPSVAQIGSVPFSPGNAQQPYPDFMGAITEGARAGQELRRQKYQQMEGVDGAPTQVQASQQFRPATDVEIKAAYCMISVKYAIDVGQKIMPSKAEMDDMRNLPTTDPNIIMTNKFIDAQNAMISDFNRYRQYVMLTLTSNVDPFPILLAEKHAKEDDDRAEAIFAEAHCPSLRDDPTMSCTQAVNEKLEIKEIHRRTSVCAHSDWLPF